MWPRRTYRDVNSAYVNALTYTINDNEDYGDPHTIDDKNDHRDPY
jgi:hypothetical protein